MLWDEFIFRLAVMERKNSTNTGQLKDIAIVRNNLIVYDTGLVRVIRSLARRYSTLVLGWDRERTQPYDSDKLKKQILGKGTTNNSIDLKILKPKSTCTSCVLCKVLAASFFLPCFLDLGFHEPGYP